MYLILSTETIKPQDLLCFSPQMMQWDESTWIIDYSLTLGYWQKRALYYGVSIAEMFRKTLNHLAHDWIAVISSTIFPGVLMTKTLKQRKLRGLLNSLESFGQSFFKQVEWKTWFEEARKFGELCEKISLKGFRAATFWKGLKHFEQAEARLSTKLDWYIQNISPTSIQRRFAADVAKLWSFTFLSPAKESTSFSEQNFPWQDWKAPTTPSVRRISESVLCSWDHMESFLREDFDRLIPQTLDSEGILSYSWTLHLTNGKEHKIPVHFRIPHLLHREKGDHKSSLAQCFFSFQKFDEDSEELLGVEGWTIEISHRMFLPTWLRSLFSTEMDVNMEKIVSLENLIPYALQVFGVTQEWLPEKSFSQMGMTNLNVPHKYPSSYFKHRPLFIYEEVEPYDLSRARKMQFLERISNHWWDSSQACVERDYYRVQDRSKKDLWVYLERREEKICAFTQGVYG